MTKKEEAQLKRAAKLEAERARCEQMKAFEREVRVRMPASQGGILVCGIDEAGRGPFAGPVVAGAVILDIEDPEKEILYLNDSKKLSEKKREMLYREILGKAVAVGVGYTGARIIDRINILQATYRAMRQAIANLQSTADLADDEDDTHQLVQKLIRLELPQALRPEPVEEQAAASEQLSADEAASTPEQLSADGQISAPKPEPADEADAQTQSEQAGSPHIVPDYILADAVTIPGIDILQQGIVKGDAKSLSIAAASIVAKVTRDHIMYEYDRLHPAYGFASHKGYGTAAHIAAIREHGMLDIHRRSFIHLK